MLTSVLFLGVSSHQNVTWSCSCPVTGGGGGNPNEQGITMDFYQVDLVEKFTELCGFSSTNSVAKILARPRNHLNCKCVYYAD